jgi:hypothetical protein
MRDAPDLNPRDMHRVAEVVVVLWFDQPSSLTGSLARATALRGGAETLTLAVAVVEIKKLRATQTLTLSCLRHNRSSTESRKAAPSATLSPSGAV